MATQSTFNWDDIRRLADELEVKMHLAGMEARDRWRDLQPRLADLEKSLARTTERVGDVLTQELTAVGKALRQLRDDVAKNRAKA
jgi:hypothetical protein